MNKKYIKKEELNDYSEIILKTKKEEIGTLTFSIIKKEEILGLNIDLEESTKLKIEKLDLIYLIDYLDIKKEFQNQENGKILMNELIKYLKGKKQNIAIYINVSPLDNNIDLKRLYNFYKSFGFNTIKKYKTNISLISYNVSKLKLIKLKSKKNKIIF